MRGTIERGLGSAKPKQSFGKISPFVKLFREAILAWAAKNSVQDSHDPTGDDLPSARVRDFFLDKLKDKLKRRVTPETFRNWWNGNHPPHAKTLKILVEFLCGDEASQSSRELKAAWTEVSRKRSSPKTVEEEPIPLTLSGRSYYTAPGKSDGGHSRVVKMVVDLPGVGRLMSGGTEEGAPIILDLSFGFEDDRALPCRLYIKEFHLIADTEIGDEVAGSFYKGAKSNGVEVAYNGGGRWVVKPSDGERLEGQLDTIEQLFLVRPSATPDKDGKLISVKVSGICPGTSRRYIEVEWLGHEPDQQDTGQASPPPIRKLAEDPNRTAVIEAWLKKCLRADTGGTVELGWRSRELIVREP